jgi:hypothetical protein
MKKLFGLMLILSVVFALSSVAFAQGKSNGKGKGKSGNVGRGNQGNSDTNDDRGRGRDEDNDNKGRGKDRDSDDYNNHNSKRYNGLAKKIGMSPEAAQTWYETEKRLNPDLTYGQFVAANMIARKHGSHYPNLTTERILGELRDGRSLGQAIKNLGLNDKDAEKERKRIRKEIGDDTDRDFRIIW